MKKTINILISISVNPFGAYMLSFLGLFVYFFYISSDALSQALIGSFFFAFFVAFAVVFIGSLAEEVSSF